MAKHSIVELVGDGATDTFAVNFTGGYMDESHVTAQVNDEVDGAGDPIYRTLTFVSAGIVQVGGTVPGVGEPVLFERNTPVTEAVNDYGGGSVFSTSAVDQSFDQLLKGVQEAQDITDDLIDLTDALESTQEAADAAAVSAAEAAGYAAASDFVEFQTNGGTIHDDVTLAGTINSIGSTSGSQLDFVRTNGSAVLKTHRSTNSDTDTQFLLRDKNNATIAKIVGAGTTAGDGKVIMTREKADLRYLQRLEFDTMEDFLANTAAISNGTLVYVTDGAFEFEAVNSLERVFDAGGQGYRYIVPGHGVIDVRAMGAVNTPGEDNLSAFETADLVARLGGHRVYIPEGVWDIDGEWKLNDYSHIFGRQNKSLVRQISSTMADNVITTTANTRVPNTVRNTDIYIEGIEVDGNYTRNAGPYSGVAHSGGCGFSMVNVDRGTLRNCHAKHCTKHGFDITSPAWNVSGGDPETRPIGGCRDVLLENCSATNFGDDGITIHYSRQINVVNCSAWDGGDFYSVGNSNGLEIDDGSIDVVVQGGHFTRCSRGVQIKAHNYAPAAQCIRLFGVTCENNGQNFVLLHDGFSSGTPSTSAHSVELHGCVSVTPRKRNAETRDRRALSISQYGGVFVNGFTIIGDADPYPQTDPDYLTDASSNYAVVVYSNARDVVLQGLRFQNVTSANTALLKVNASAKDVTIRDVVFDGCADLPIKIDSGTEGVIIDGVRARNPVGSPTRVIDCTNSPIAGQYTIDNVQFDGYTNAYQLSSEDYPLPFRVCRGVVTGSGTAYPDNVYPAPRGSVYHRSGSTNPGLYVKESGDNTSAGWVAK